MKHKMHSILTGETPNDAVFLNVISRFPDIYDQNTKQTAHLERRKATALEYRIIAEMRTTAARHEYSRNHDRQALDVARAGQSADNEKETPDDAPIDHAPPSGLESDSRVLQALAELENLEGAGNNKTPTQNLADTMDVDEDGRSLSAVEDDNLEDLVDGEGMQSGESSSTEQADLTEEDNEADVGDADVGEDEVDMNAEEEAEEEEDA